MLRTRAIGGVPNPYARSGHSLLMPVVWRVHADADDRDRDANAREKPCAMHRIF